MKKECAYTQGMLLRYLKGYLFLPQRNRVERHLASCPVCRSRSDALRQTDATREILRHLDANEGIVSHLKTGLGRIARLFFMPLWLALVVAVALAVQTYVIAPLLHDPDLEKLDAGAPPPGSAKLEAAPFTLPASTHAVPVATVLRQPAQAPPGLKTEPLVIIVSLEKEHEKAGMARINEAMKEHALLANLRFSEKVHMVTGSLTPDELYTFFSRIREAGHIIYKRSRLSSAAPGEPLPFVLKLQTVAPPPRPPKVQPAERTPDRPAERAADSSAAVPSDRPVERAADSSAVVPSDRPAGVPAEPPKQAPQ